MLSALGSFQHDVACYAGAHQESYLFTDIMYILLFIMRDRSIKSNTSTWVALGMLTLVAQKGAQHIFDLQKHRLSAIQLQKKVLCRIVVQCDPVETYINHYKLQIIQKKGQELIGTKIHREVLLQNFYDTNVINFQDRKILRLSNPCLTKDLNILQTRVMSQYKQQSEFQVEVEVLEQILITMTETYERQEQKGRIYKLQQDQHNNRTNKQQNQLFCEDQFLNILSKLKRKKYSGYMKLENHKQHGVGSRENSSLQLTNSINSMRGNQNKTQAIPNCTSTTIDPKVITIQKSGDDVPGLYFDLNQSTFQTKEPPGFIEKLKPYQAKALTWMLFREGQIKDIGIDMFHAPLWTDKGAELGLKQKLFICNKLSFVVWKRSVQKKCNGGILADQMGLGKTIMIIALIVAHQPSQKCKTLIIAPLSVISQWQNQIYKFAPSLRVLSNSQRITRKQIKQHDVVIVNQFRIRSQLAKTDSTEDETLLDYDWFRVVIDEAHNFKNSESKMAEAVYSLYAEYRWCLSGTPGQNKIGDFYSLCKFLRFQLWDQQSWWQALFPDIDRNFRDESSPKNLTDLKQLLKGVLLRRRIQSVDEQGKKLLELPKAQIRVHKVSLSKQAKAFYKTTQQYAKEQIKAFEDKYQKNIDGGRRRYGRRTYVQKRKINRRNQMNKIFRLILKLRMICCHQFLDDYCSKFIKFDDFKYEYQRFLNKNKITRIPKYNFFQSSLLNSQKQANIDNQPTNLKQVYDYWADQLQLICKGKIGKCQICGGLNNGMITPCLHVFCLICITDHVTEQWQVDMQHILEKSEGFQKLKKSQKRRRKIKEIKLFESKCPKCGQKFKLKQIFNLPRQNKFNRSFQEFVPNQKILALMGYLKEMKPNEKAIVYTSFLGMMDLICRQFDQQKVTYRTIKGRDSSSKRNQIIEEFNSYEKTKVLLMTLKTGSVGLNMQVANKVFFMDPWWNPITQQQAIGRVHRFGQTKQVEAVKFITDCSIETRIVKLSYMKKKMINCILDVDDVVNDKQFSNSRQQIKYLLKMQESFKYSDEEVEQEMGDDVQEMNKLKESINQEIVKILENKQHQMAQNDNNSK